MTEKPTPGVVYLIGAGPGAADLITVRGLRYLRQADVVIYDRLVSEALVAEAPPHAERIYVGKAPGRHTCSQAEIHALMIDRARAGKAVVRLKGGDPCVFGRGGEEMQALARAGIPFVIVPGVSSATGVPTAAGIPLTHRDVAGAFAVVSAHRAGTRDDVDWAALARVDTLVILMGVARLHEITHILMAHGRAPDTPVALVERGTLPDERVLLGTLADIAARARTANVRPPAVIIVGKVVGQSSSQAVKRSPSWLVAWAVSH